jgi:hypothetical protein
MVPMKKAWLSHLTPFAKIIFVLMLIIVGLILAVLGGILVTMIQYHADMAEAVLLISNKIGRASCRERV